MNAWTPGPWTVSNEPNGFFIYSDARKQVNDPAIAHVYKDREQDAHLIALAPEMAEALAMAHRQLAKLNDDSGARDAIECVRALLARLEGGK